LPVLAGWPGKLLGLSLLAYAILWVAGAGLLPKAVALFGAALFATVLLIRMLAAVVRRLIWRLRNRLVVAYLFIAVVPILLLLVMAELGAYTLAGQVGSYLLKSEFERRATALRQTALSLAALPPAARAEAVRRSGAVFRERFPGLELLVEDLNGAEVRFPAESSLAMPPKGFGEASGAILRNGFFHLWAHAGASRTEAVILVPVTRTFLQQLMPELGDVTLIAFSEGGLTGQPVAMKVFSTAPGETRGADSSASLDGEANFFDLPVRWGIPLAVALWEDPNGSATAILGIRTRISTVLRVLFSQKTESDNPGVLTALNGFLILFVVVQLISLAIGISVSRVIPRAVENLYEGTQEVKEANFGYRIQVAGNDQLAELGRSFNLMTSNLERLLQVEKERERLHAELEIAREVQSQLHPQSVPELATLRLTSSCTPARMVSGDYFDYQMVNGGRVALAIGDVAGKGISAALLMATLQSAMRSQLRHCAENAGASPAISTSRLISNLNLQVHASTSPEKYATFYFGVYDDATGLLTYTNAGHLPPILLRRGEPRRLDVNGMVVGAFPFAQYQESQLQLEPGDLLVCYTDGITEPENEYGEMFGEHRLVDLVQKHLELPDPELVALIVDTVRGWTASPELQDDMTILLARKS
jgi:sigma-B regulation protein RsbU (phosphoserine phosphatase)